MNYTEKSTLAEIVKNDINTAKIFESYGLDFCCNGKRPLDEACHEKNLEPKKILDEISAKTDNNESADFNSMDIKDLTDYIIGKHHEYIRNIIPTIRSFGEKVVRAHSANHSEVKKIAELYMRVSIDLENHLMKEENILFPYFKSLSQAKNTSMPIPVPHFNTVRNPINMMEQEHTDAGDIFHEIRKLSDDYKTPPDACNTFIAYYNELKNFEDDLHVHIHLENNILHPRAIALEDELRNSGLIK